MGWQDAPIVKPAGAAQAKQSWEDAPIVKPAEKAQEQPGPIRQGLEFIGRQLNRAPAAINGSIQGLQDFKDPLGPSKLAIRGFLHPESVQSTATTLERMGVPNNPTPRMKQVNGNWVPGIPDNERQQDGKGGFTGDSTGVSPGLASGLGIVADAVAPTGLEGLGPLMKASLGLFKGSAKLGLKVAATVVDVARGGNEARTALHGAGEGIQAYKARQAAQINAVLNPKLASDANEIKAVGKAVGFTPQELSHPAIEFGHNSEAGRRFKVLAQGEGGQPYLDIHNSMTGKIQNGFDKTVEAIGGGTPLEPVQAGEMIKKGVFDGAKRIADAVSVTHADIIKDNPGLMVSGRELGELGFKVNQIEKFAKGRAVRGVVPEQMNAAQSILKSVASIRNTKASYKQLNEARQIIGDVAFQPVGAFESLPTYQKKMQELYFAINDALIGTVGKADKVKAGQFRKPGVDFAPLKEQLIESNKTLHDLFQDEGAIGGAIGQKGKAAEKIYADAVGDTRKVQALKKLLSPEEFKRLQGSYINNLVKKGKDEVFFRSGKNTLAQNRSVVGEMFADAPEKLAPVTEMLNLGDRIGPPLLPGSAGQLDFGGANSISKALLDKITAPIGDVTAEMGKARARAPIVGKREPLKIPFPIAKSVRYISQESE